MRSVLIAVGLVAISSHALAHSWFTDKLTIESWPPVETREFGADNDWLNGKKSMEDEWELKDGTKYNRVGCCGGSDCFVYDVEEKADGMYFPELNYLAPWWRIQPSKDGTWRACKLASDPYPRCIFGPIQNSNTYQKQHAGGQ